MQSRQQSPKASGTDDSEGTDGIEQVKNVVPQLPQYLHRAVEGFAPQDGFTVGKFSVTFELGSNKGDGFVGQLFKAIVTESDRKSEYLCKIPPLDDARREQFHSMTAFAREALVYADILPKIYEYQRAKGLTSPGEGFFHAPRCYHAYCDEAAQESVILMEDLRLRNFQMWNKHNPIDHDHAKLVMEHIGRLHAVSLAMKRDRPEEFEAYKLSNTLDIYFEAEGPFRNMVLSQMQMAIDALEEHDHVGRQKLEALKPNTFRELKRCSDTKLAEPYSVIRHGDCWSNNIMFRYEDGAPKEMVLVDWQNVSYVSPAQDIVYFIYSCTDEAFRERYYFEMIDIYYRSLSATLEKLQHDANELFPRSALDEQLRQYGGYGFLMAIFLIPMMCTRNEELPDFEERAHKMQSTDQQLNESFFSTSESSHDAYTTRMRGVVRDCIRYGYL
ncbi:uncharacterized protein LOC128275177 [Anopheles cruzii]|uniref:uncharacterized protein LOC128275177 n=1 Tax=Anopheles cruzii TaxID=68878 RepID=UPI0022EC26D0|nr:uncharacterized protein LOC128275177 [Anopheles cruzii]